MYALTHLRTSNLIEKMVMSLTYYGDSKWVEGDIEYILGMALLGLEPDEDDLQALSSKTTLLPPKLLPQLDEKALLNRLPRCKIQQRRNVEQKDLELISTGHFNDDDFKRVFPARTDTDMNIRRARAKTIYHIYKLDKQTKEWQHWITELTNFDYITVCNLMLFHAAHGYDWLHFWKKSGCLTNLDDLQNVTKMASTLLKKYPTTMEMRHRYCECGGVSGYRNPPFGDFDFVAESKRLADGGEQHGLVGTSWSEWFDEAVEDATLFAQPKKVEYMSLRDYIASDLASTHGASSFGKVEWEFEGEHGHFKARKNFILDITTVDYLYEQTLLHLGKQVNKSFIKPELGKMRIAVTGDIWSYFSQSWLNYLCGGVYLKWPGNTLDETVPEQAERMDKMLLGLAGHYGLPFDFAEFDHQPSMDEVRKLVHKYVSSGKVNVPASEIMLWEQIVVGTVESFSNAFIIASAQQTDHVFRVQGGVNSGIRLTSLLGNMWNQVITQSVKNLLRRLGYAGAIPSWLRGDDSAIEGENYWVALLFRLGYQCMNARGNDIKYGIHYGETEFLRTWYKDKCSGFANRSLPGIMQRKPWSSDPWDPESVLKAQISTIHTLERRGIRNTQTLSRAVIQDWTRMRSQTARWLQVPVSMGGLGILPFQGWIPNKPWPVMPKPPVTFKTHVGSEMRYMKRFEYWQPTIEEMRAVQQRVMLTKAISDDIRGMGQVFRKDYTKAVRDLGIVQWSIVDIKKQPVENMADDIHVLANLVNVEGMRHEWNNVSSTFGQFKAVSDGWQDAVMMSQVRKTVRPITWLREQHPGCWIELRRLERHGFHRATALDLLFGTLSGLVTGRLHPMLVRLVQNRVVNRALEQSKWDRQTWGWFTSRAAYSYSTALDSSGLAQRLFQW